MQERLFGIFQPEYMKTDIESILLKDTLLANSKNVWDESGLLERMPARLRELVEAVYSTGMVVTVATSATVVVISGSVYSAAAQYPAWGSDDIAAATGRAFICGDESNTLKSVDSAMQITLDANATESNGALYAITVVHQGNKKFTIAGAHASDYTVADKIAVNGSTGNDGTYTVASATEIAGPNTEIVVDEAVPDATADGNITDKGIAYTIGTALTMVPTPDGNPVLRYHRHTVGDNEYLFAYTKAHVYLWSTTWTAWILKFTCSGDCTMWDTESFEPQDWLISTNNVDLVQKWGITGGCTLSAAFANLEGASGLEYATGVYVTAAKFVSSYENYLILGYTTEDGTECYHRRRWSEYKDCEVWDAGQADYSDVEGRGALTGFGHDKGLHIAFKERSRQKFWLVGGSSIFNKSTVSWNCGTEAPHAVVEGHDDELYFFGSDMKFKRNDGFVISDDIANLCENFQPELIPIIQGTVWEEWGVIVWTVPYGPNATACNRLLIYKPGEYGLKGKWWIQHIPVTAFGNYARTAQYTIDTIPFPTIDSIAWPKINFKDGQVGFVPDIGGDASGYTYQMHASQRDDNSSGTALEYDGEFEIDTDLMAKQGISYLKDCHWIDLYAKNEGGTKVLSLWIKADDEPSYRYMGDFSLAGSGGLLRTRLYVDYMQGRHFGLKLTASNRFRVAGLVFGYAIFVEV